MNENSSKIIKYLLGSISEYSADKASNKILKTWLKINKVHSSISSMGADWGQSMAWFPIFTSQSNPYRRQAADAQGFLVSHRMTDNFFLPFWHCWVFVPRWAPKWRKRRGKVCIIWLFDEGIGGWWGWGIVTFWKTWHMIELAICRHPFHCICRLKYLGNGDVDGVELSKIEAGNRGVENFAIDVEPSICKILAMGLEKGEWKMRNKS